MSGLDQSKATVRSVTGDARDIGNFSKVVDEIYNDDLDVVRLRGAFPKDLLAKLGQRLDRNRETIRWERPNSVMPPDDIYILGTDVPATPTYKAPRGGSLESYLESASRFPQSLSELENTGFDISRTVEEVLSRLAGGRPVEVAVADDGRRYVPYTIRLLADGKRISIHHDYHYPLGLYKDIAPRVDTRTLVSFFITLQKPDSGGELVVYALRSDNPDQPRLPSGQWDADAIAQANQYAIFDTEPGDLILLAAGRCFHRVERVTGASRVTLGAFLAFAKDHSRVLYWS